MFWKKRVVRVPVRELEDKELEAAFAVGDATPLLVGIRELIDRYMLEAMEVMGDEGELMTHRVGAAVRLKAMQDLRGGIAMWQERGLSVRDSK